MSRGTGMLWGLNDHFVQEVISVYRSREQAERALETVLADEPDWKGMLEIVPVDRAAVDRHWQPKGRPVRRPRCVL